MGTLCGRRPNGHFIAECRVCRIYRKTHGGHPPSKRTRALLTTVALAALTLQAVLAHAQPLPIPATEFTACEQLVSAWVEAHSVTLGIVGVMALIGFFNVTHYLMRVLVGLGERAWEKVRGRLVGRKREHSHGWTPRLAQKCGRHFASKRLCSLCS